MVQKVTLDSMHRVLFIREILLDIFSYLSPVAPLGLSCNKADLAALARTCQTFKEPALDVLWEILFDLSPLARCLIDACRFDGLYYSFRRPLSDAEWKTVRGYARRVRSIHQFLPIIRDQKVALFLAPFTGPLFPNLRSLYWDDFKTLPVTHTAVPSLTSLSFSFIEPSEPLETEHFDIIGERCPNIRRFSASFSSSGPLDAIISRQLSRWMSLQYADCREITLNMDFILHLPSLSALKQLSFTLSANLGNHTTRLCSEFVLSNLADLDIKSTSLKSVTTFISCIQLPTIKGLCVSISEYTPKRDVREYWVTLQKACPSSTLANLSFSSSEDKIGNPDHSEQTQRPWLTLDDLLPYKDFANLSQIDMNVGWSVNLTDADILDLVSTSPRLEKLSINDSCGWKMGRVGGITLSGLVQLLRQCPSLCDASLVIDTRTFIQIPHGLDVSFPPRETFSLDCLDSHFPPRFCWDLKSVFAALRLSVWSSVRLDINFTSSDESEDTGSDDAY